MTHRARRTPEDIAAVIGLGKVIARLRREEGMTQALLAQRAELSASSLRAVERGEAEAQYGTVRRIAQGLDVELGDLLHAAREAAPGEGGDAWRRWSRGTKKIHRDAGPGPTVTA